MDQPLFENFPKHLQSKNLLMIIFLRTFKAKNFDSWWSSKKYPCENIIKKKKKNLIVFEKHTKIVFKKILWKNILEQVISKNQFVLMSLKNFKNLKRWFLIVFEDITLQEYHSKNPPALIVFKKHLYFWFQKFHEKIARNDLKNILKNK